MEKFTRTSSISRKLTMATLAVAGLFFLQLFGVYVSARSFLSGISDLYQQERLSDTLTELHQITDWLIEIPGSVGKSRAESKRLFDAEFAQAQVKLGQASALAEATPDFSRELRQTADALDLVNRSAQGYFRPADAVAEARELLLSQQYGLDATENQEKLKLLIQARSETLFNDLYRARYRPLGTAILLTSLLVLFAMLGAWTLRRQLAQSIDNLVGATREVARGHLAFQAPILSSDEFGMLTNAFNSMIRELQRSTVSREYFETLAIENSRLYHEAQEAVRSRDEFLSIASHEVKTPLTSLSLQLQILNRQIQKSLNDERAKNPGLEPERVAIPVRTLRVVASAETQSGKLANLIDELLDLTRIRLGRLSLAQERVDLGAVAQEVIERFKAEAAQKGISIHLDAEVGAVGCWDPMRIEQVVSNLVSNALKYGNGSPVFVSVRKRESDHQARLTVADRGAGIPAEMRERIFERFERAGVSGKQISGLGLGLYICRQIVEAHGGLIRVENRAEGGASFTVDLPLPSAEENVPKTGTGG